MYNFEALNVKSRVSEFEFLFIQIHPVYNRVGDPDPVHSCLKSPDLAL